MQKFVVGFSRSRKTLPIGSWIIRLYQCTPFSHVYIRRTSPVFTSDIIIHASEGLVQRMSGIQFDKKHLPTSEFELCISKDKWIELRNLMHDYSGDNYSMMQNVGIALVDFMSLFNVHIKNPFRKGWNCSEFVMTVLQELYPEDFSGLDKDTITPKQVYQILLSLETRGLVRRIV